jgi:hypothetical protein
LLDIVVGNHVARSQPRILRVIDIEVVEHVHLVTPKERAFLAGVELLMAVATPVITELLEQLGVPKHLRAAAADEIEPQGAVQVTGGDESVVAGR